MKLCGSVFRCRICSLIVFINLLLIGSFVNAQNLPPVLSLGISNQHAETDSIFSFTIPNEAFSDRNHDVLSYTAETVPATAWPSWLTFNPDTRNFSGIPVSPSTITIKVKATDPGGLFAEKTFRIIVHPHGSTYAAFTMNSQIGCNSRFVQFENKSSKATSYRWNFGNGNISTLPTPIANYTKPGTYTVTLQINNEPGLVYTDIIQIFPIPSPTVDQSIEGGCEPFTATLNSTGEPVLVEAFEELGQQVGAITGGAEKYYYWYSESFPNQPERFSLTKNIEVGSLEYGSYTVALEVTDENGCSRVRNFNDLFQVHDKPVAEFTFVKSDPCRPSNTTFTRESTIEGSQITGHEWKVNGVTRGTGDSFEYVFTAGQHIVTLTETSENGCISEPFKDTVVFNTNNNLDFTYTPAITCFNSPTQFNSQSISPGNILSYSWDFDGNGSSDTQEEDPSFSLSSSGNVPVTLTAEFNDGCVKKITKDVRIDEVLADFEYVYHGGCDNYMTVDFVDISTTTLGSAITGRKWYYRQSGAPTWSMFSVIQNPILPIIPSGIYDIRIIASSSTGCVDTLDRTIPLVSSKTDMLISGAVNGCFPSGETFFEAIFNSEYDTPVSYNWQFGDGETGTGASVTHTYSTPGNYNVRLIIQTEDGCTYTLNRNNAVQFADQPAITDVILHQSNNCLNTPVILEIDYPDGTDSLRIYLPGDSIVYIKNLSTPNHNFSHRFKDIGNFSIGVEAIDNNCHSAIFTVSDIQINGPKALFRPQETAYCSNPPYDAHFVNLTSNNTTPINYTWDFGDGTALGGVENPTHNYTTTGDFTVVLSALDPNSGCTSTFSHNVSIFSFDNTPGIIEADNKSGCAPLTVNFTQNILERLSDNYIVSSYEWDFNNDGTTDSTTNSESLLYTYTTPGQYSVGLKVNSESGCTYSFTEDNLIRANGQIVQFTHSPSTVCSGTEVTFTNNSTQPAGDTGVAESFTWNFGDGTMSGISNTKHTYSKDTIFTVSLTIRDSNGCTQTLEKKDLINIQPFNASFTIDRNIACDGSEITFVNTSEGNNLTYEWDFNSDGTNDLTSGQDTIIYIYNQYGDFNPTLTAITPEGCRKSVSQGLRIINATADFTAAETTIGCAPSNAVFASIANADDVISYSWSFGDGISSNERSPVHRYYTPGYHDVELSIEFKGVCFRTVTKEDFIFVRGAYGVLNYDATPSCSPNEVEFILSDMRSVDYLQWDFGDGHGESYSVIGNPESDTIRYSYLQSGFTKPSVVLSSNDCPGSYTYEKNVTGSEPLEIYTSLPPKAEIWMDRNIICEGVGLQFRDSSDVRDTLFPASEWRWVFASTHAVSDESNEQNPVYAYDFPGYFTPKLIVSNELGCSDSTTSLVEIKSSANITSDFTASDLKVCPDQEITLSGDASSSNGPIIKYQWDFGDGSTSSEVNTIHSYGYAMKGQSIDVIFIATDEVLCSDSTTRTVDINNLQAALGYRPQPVYRGGLVDFEDLSVSDYDSINSRNWSFENGLPSVSTNTNPENILYNQILNDNQVRLIVTNTNGCSDTATMSIDVLNNPPVLTSFPISILRNTIYTFNPDDFITRFDPADPGQILEYIRISSLPTIGELTYNGASVNAGQLISASNISGLKYTSTSVGFGNFEWNGWDGMGYSNDNALVQIEILKEPDPPTLNDLVFNVSEDFTLTFELDTFRNRMYFDNSTFPGFNLERLIINSIPLPQQGTLTYNGVPVTPGQEFNSSQISGGSFTVDPVNGYEGTITFSWNGFDGLKWGTSDANVIVNYINAPPVLSEIIFENLVEDSVINLSKGDFISRYNDPDINDSPDKFFLDIPSYTKGTFRINGVVVPTGLYSLSFSTFTTLRYTPENGGNDIVDVRWGAFDGQDTTFAVFRLTYINTPPVCHDFSLTGNEDEILRFTYSSFSEKYPTGPFEEPDEFDILDSIRILSLPNHGSLTYLSIPFNVPYSRGKNFISNLRYTPNENWSGRDSFIYSGFDGTTWSENTSWVILQINPVNDPPYPESDYYVINEDRHLIDVNVKDNDIDIDDDHAILTVIIKDGGTAENNGTISLNQNGLLTYRPSQDVNGGVWFTYEICDDEPECSVDSVIIDILPMNDPPTATDDSIKITEATVLYESDISTNLMANDYDIDNNKFRLLLAGGKEPGTEMIGQYGKMIINPDGSFTYIPEPDSVIKLDQSDTGRDVFNYSITDDSLSTSTANVTILIVGSNNPPEVTADTIKINEGAISVMYPSIIKNDYDPEGKTLQLIKVNNSTDKELTDIWGKIYWAETGSIIYEQNNYSTDYLKEGEILDLEYQYSVSDGQVVNNSGIFIIRVIGVNDPPVAVTDNLIYEEDWDSVEVKNTDFAWILRNDYDPDDYVNSLTIKEINGNSSSWLPSVGTVGILKWNPDGTFKYIPDKDSIIQLKENDIITDIFRYIVTDPLGLTDTDSLIITIIGANDKPNPENDTLRIFEDTFVRHVPADSGLLVNDSDPEHQKIIVEINGLSSGTITGLYGVLLWDSTGNYSYLSNPDLVNPFYKDSIKTDVFYYTIKDPEGSYETASLSVIITGQNDAPFAFDNYEYINEKDPPVNQSDPARGLLSGDFDLDDGDQIKVISVNDSTVNKITGKYGNIEWLEDGTFIYALNPETDTLSRNEEVTDIFKYSILDKNDSTGFARLVINITGENDNPVAVNDTLLISEDTLSVELINFNETLLFNDTDKDGDSIKMISMNNIPGSPLVSKYCTIEWDSAGAITYFRNEESDTIPLGLTVHDSIRYTILDQYSYESNAWLHIFIKGENDNPVAIIDKYEIPETTDSLIINSDSGILSNDYDVDSGDTITVSQIKDKTGYLIYGVYGDLNWNSDGSFIYYNKAEATDTLKEGEIVIDYFPYTLSDNNDATDIDTLEIKITGVNDIPVAIDDVINISEDTISVTLLPGENGLLENDFDVDGDKISVIFINDSQERKFDSKYGSVIWAEDGLFIFTPDDRAVDLLKYNELVSDSIYYVIADLLGRRDTATIIINITGENDNPLSADDYIQIDEDTDSISVSINDPGSLLINDTDIDKDLLSVFMINDSQEKIAFNVYGELNWDSTGSYIFYTNRTETDKLAFGDTVNSVFEYIVQDLFGGTDTSKLIIEITGVNDPPVAMPDSFDTYDVKSVIIKPEDENDILDNDYDVDGTLRSITDINEIQKDTIIGKYGVLIWKPDGSFEYYPDSVSAVALRPGESINDDFSYIIKDEWSSTDTSTINIKIIGVNNAPIALNDTLIVYEDDISKQLPGLGLVDAKVAIDSDRDTLLVSSVENSQEPVASGVYGEIFWKADGTAVYTPNKKIHQLGPNQTVSERFSYIIKDNELESNNAELIVILLGMNDDIYAVNDTDTINEDSNVRINVITNDLDPDNFNDGNYDYSSLTILQNPLNGKAYINSSNGVISYFPDKNFNGKDSLHYKICDTGMPVYCDDAWMIITVDSVNDPPKPTPLVLETNINTPVTFNALDQVFDIDDGINPGSIDISGVNKIKLSGDSIIYTPDSSYTGKDEFTYSVSDYEGVPAFVIVTVIVKDTLSEFIAANDTITIQENNAVNISILENDSKGNEFPDPRSLEIKVFPENGVSEYDWYKQVITYQPDKNFNGKDSITYIVASGLKNWSSAKVYINVEPVNDSLRANDDLAETLINTPVEIDILKNDIDSDNGLDYTSVNFNTEIEYNDETGIVTYTPPLNFKGIYSFTYKVCDNDFINTSCDSATVVVIVSPKKKELYAINDNYSTFENDTIDLVEPLPWENDSLIVSDNKIVPDSFNVVLQPQHGTYTLNKETNIITYIPERDYFGNDWITYSIYDSAGNFDVAEINIWVEKVNVPPVLVNDNYMISQNEYKRLYILENDYDIDGNLDFSTLKITSHPNSGKDSIDVKTGTIFYKPDVNKGDDSLRYTICDNEGACSSASVKMTIELDTSIFIYLTTLEDNPVETDIKAEMEKYNFKFNITDVVEEESPEIGKWELSENNSILTYTPEKDSTGDDNFRLNVCSGESGQCAFLRIYIKVLPVNDPPVAINDTIFWNHITDTTTISFNDITKNDYDIDSEVIILDNKVVDSGDSLIIKFNTDKELITITADTIFWCDAWFTYKILDQEGASDTGKVFIFPYPDSYNFLANDDEVEVFENSKDNLLNILENDIFIDNQLCTIDTVIIITPSVNGVSSATTDNNISYAPRRHYYGKDSLQYQIIDLWGKEDSAWVYIDVLERNTPPLANPDDTIAAFGTVINIPVLLNDYDPDAIDLPDSPGDPEAYIDSARTILISDPLYGTAYFDPATYNIVYTPNVESCENDVFQYMIFDNENDSSTTTITIIMPEEAPIIAIPDTVKTYPGIPVEVEPLLNDQGYFGQYIENNTIPSNGFISVSSTNIVRYTPNKDFIGRDSIKYSIISPCENISETYIIFLVEELRVPEIITPNGDGKNDVLIIDGIEYFPDNMLQIYNRYGHIVYSKKGYDNVWGGNSNKGSLFGDKPLPAGTYYWTLIYNEGRNRQAGIIYIFR